MKLVIEASDLQILQNHATEGYPHEVVGILAGIRESGEVQRVSPLLNERAETKNRYKVSPLILMRAEQKLEREGLEIIGYYHSHPDHSAQYSEYDREHALPNMSYLILSICKQTPKEYRSWRLSEDRSVMHPETIVIR